MWCPQRDLNPLTSHLERIIMPRSGIIKLAAKHGERCRVTPLLRFHHSHSDTRSSSPTMPHYSIPGLFRLCRAINATRF
jgi:hypothetical protein